MTTIHSYKLKDWINIADLYTGMLYLSKSDSFIIFFSNNIGINIYY